MILLPKRAPTFKESCDQKIEFVKACKKIVTRKKHRSKVVNDIPGAIICPTLQVHYEFNIIGTCASIHREIMFRSGI